MAYSRRRLFESPLIGWHQVQLDDAHPAWSDSYRVAGFSLLLPTDLCFECRIGTDAFVCDSAAALWLSPERGYRLRRPWSRQRSMLLTLAEDPGFVGRSPLSLGLQLDLLRRAQSLATAPVDRLAVEEGLARWIDRLRPTAIDTPARPHRAVERAREHIATDPGRSDTLADIASAANCSAFHLARRFRQQTGQSLHGFRTQLRMTAALDRLRQGDQDLSALAADLGYASHSHFTGVFRREFGRTPSQLRTNLAAPERT